MKTALVAGAALTGLLVAPPAAGFGAVPSAAPVPAAASTAPKDDVLLDFDDGTATGPDLSNSGSATVSTSIAAAEEGTVLTARRGSGKAARLEPFDPESPADLAVVVVRPGGDQDALAPRRGGFAFGAAFRLDAKSEGSDVDNGNNLVQRGLYRDTAQYKLQVDNGRVSCRVLGASGGVQVTSTNVRTRLWHRVRCVRSPDSVKLVVVALTDDGPVKRIWTRKGRTGDLAFSGRPPLSIGGKVDNRGALVEASADQFNGRVDNVFFRRLAR